MRSALRVHLVGIRLAVAGRMAYRGDFFISVALTFVSEFIAPLVVYLVYRTGAAFPGWSLAEALLVQAVFLLARGLAFPLFFGMIGRTLGSVREGTFDLLLIKPRPVLQLSLATAFEVDDLGKLVSGLVLLTIALSQLPHPNAWQWLQFGLLLLLSVLVLFGFALLMTGVAIRWVGNSRIYEIFDCVTNFGLYPKTIFSRSFQTIISIIVPIAMLGFFPAAALLGKPDSTTWAAGGVCLLFFATCFWFWRSMLKYYTSAGG